MTEPTAPPTHVHTHAPAGLDLSKKYGPLNGYTWLIIVAVGIAGVVYLRRRSAGSTTSTTSDGSTNPTATSGDGGSSYGGGSSTGSTGVAATTAVADTNGAWGIRVANGLAGTNGWSGTDVSNAVAAYLSGQQLTAAQDAIINAALGAYGQPPQGVISISVAPTTTTATTATTGTLISEKINPPIGKVAAPVTKAPVKTVTKTPAPVKAKPVTYRTYTVRQGDTLTAIGRKYGKSAGSIWTLNHVPGGSLAKNTSENLIYPGQVLKIPN